MFGNSLIGLLLFISHIFGSLTVGFLFRFWKKKESPNDIIYNTSIHDNKLQKISVGTLGEVLGSSISSATSTILMIGGFVVLFSVILSILNTSGMTHFITLLLEPICQRFGVTSSIAGSLFNGIFEVTNGINLIAGIKLKQISINIILTSFLLGLGGICVFLQVLSVVSKSDLSIKSYIIGKILHGCFSAFYTFLMIQIFPFFNFNL